MIDLIEKEKQILSGLKDFQLATVERVFALLTREGRSRVLVADEVGLGKTLIAKGVTAKVARYHQHELQDNLFKVVYICSNQNIAGQNLSKLKINETDRIDSLEDTRLSMQHLKIFEDEIVAREQNHYIQLIPLTPNTSFNMTNGGGSVNERALIFAILWRYPPLAPFKNELDMTLTGKAHQSWGYWAQEYDKRVEACNAASDGLYLKTMLDEISRYFATHEDQLEDIVSYCLKVRKSGSRVSGSRSIIFKLRRMMAEISVGLLNADLVIMDEFQRFPSLINSNEDNETALLAKRFLNSTGSHKERVKVLLLSATPYKLYSTLEEMNESRQDEHYQEFMQVIRFLFEHDEDLKASFHQVWSNYSSSLREMSHGELAVLSFHKKRAEEVLYQGICRTERLSVSGADKLLRTDAERNELHIELEDIHAYMQADQLLREIGLTQNIPIDYVKSAPFLLSFMEHYKLKDRITGYFRKHPEQLPLANKPALWINERLVSNYDKLPNANARFNRLKEEAMPEQAERLLWIPPSRPYYEAGGPFAHMKHFSKALVFSAWEMVPRAIAALLSYEAERLTVGKLVKQSPNPDRENRSYFPPKNKARFPLPRLKFTMRDRSPGAMNLLTLLYPSVTLAKLYQPLEALNAGMNREEIEHDLREQINALLDRISYVPKPNESGHDDRWYSLAPLLFDLQEETIQTWMRSEKIVWENDDKNNMEEQDDMGAMEKHFEELRHVLENPELVELGRRPRDLTDVLVNMCMGSPAVCALRVLGADLPSSPALAVRLAKTILDRFNMQEATAIVELCYSSRQPHWHGVLRYCVDGNLQSVLDEYAHILSEENGWNHSSRPFRSERLCMKMIDAFDTNTANYNVDTYKKFKARATDKDRSSSSFIRMRSGYAVGFYDVRSTDKSIQRKDRLRNAFNSPFRPFVLTTTSIGQEGLDFHFYCRKIVHWNLPANPIDLEQREGRINRYKSLAIRQNIAHKYGHITFQSDLWGEMFERANEEEKKDQQPELVPFWCLSEDMPVKIERVIPMYPLSRDQAKYNRLIKILSLYRLSLGQARQEELLEYVLQNDLNEEELQQLFINLSPYFKEVEKEQLVVMNS